ncbi:MAG: sialidase family protein, partial [Actinomycetota bacterium]
MKSDVRWRVCMAASTVAFLTAGLVASALPAFAITPDRTGTLTAATPFMWTGPAASGAVDPTDYAGTPCGKSFGDYCDVTLLNVDIPATFWDQRTGGVRVGLRPSLNPSSFFGLYVYRSDAAGLRGPQVAAAGPDFPTTLGVVIPNASGYYLVQVVYHLVTNDSYAAEASAFTRSRFPPRVDDPPGLQEHLASNVASGFRSHSEPHIAQSPTNPDILVAGSKFYNRDPDSLAEYNFKIGTMVSFDGGITWADLGQLAVCPPEQAPPSSWPNNSCYPDEDPAKGGNGSEDVDDPGVDDPYDPRGSGDVGEEYTTSDVWVQFDDEGNAYAMVLDAPNFAGGMGWGMTMHIWESVAPQDLLAGKTWGPRIPINKYDGASQIFLLDDKNTFAVNNAGPDGDGQTGIMVACWTQDVIVVFVPKQQIVCERSTDGGKTWPDAPLPISGIQPLTIGVDVRGDPISPNTFYAIWSNYVAGVVGAPEEMSTSRSIDGGLTWSPPLPAVAFEPIPRQFPGQEFRNLSIPILATGPNAKLYAVYAEYRPAPKPRDEDG